MRKKKIKQSSASLKKAGTLPNIKESFKHGGAG
jgi:hypothetical protein